MVYSLLGFFFGMIAVFAAAVGCNRRAVDFV